MAEQQQGKAGYSPMVKLMSLWENKSKEKGTRYWSCMLSNGVKIMMFRCQSDHPQAPYFNIYVTNVKYAGKATSTPGSRSDADDYGKPKDEGPQAEGEPVTEKDEEVPF